MKKSVVDLEAGTMTGGTKTKAGKNRVVPIHSKVRPFVETRMKEPGKYLFGYDGKKCSETQYRALWVGFMEHGE